MPDGFVTIGELTAYLNQHRADFIGLQNDALTIRGQIQADDVVLVKHGLPVD